MNPGNNGRMVIGDWNYIRNWLEGLIFFICEFMERRLDGLDGEWDWGKKKKKRAITTHLPDTNEDKGRGTFDRACTWLEHRFHPSSRVSIMYVMKVGCLRFHILLEHNGLRKLQINYQLRKGQGNNDTRERLFIT